MLRTCFCIELLLQYRALLRCISVSSINIIHVLDKKIDLRTIHYNTESNATSALVWSFLGQEKGLIYMNTPFQDDVVMTPAGYQELIDELKLIKDEKLPKAIERVAVARSFGDLSENSEYHAAREDLSFLEGRVSELEEVLMKAKVITKKGGKKSTIDLGSMVTVHIGRTKHVYQIVGEWEANPKDKKISESSPLGKALLGKKLGDEVEVDAPAGKVKYKIADIS